MDRGFQDYCFHYVMHSFSINYSILASDPVQGCHCKNTDVTEVATKLLKYTLVIAELQFKYNYHAETPKFGNLKE